MNITSILKNVCLSTLALCGLNSLALANTNSANVAIETQSIEFLNPSPFVYINNGEFDSKIHYKLKNHIPDTIEFEVEITSRNNNVASAVALPPQHGDSCPYNALTNKFTIKKNQICDISVLFSGDVNSPQEGTEVKIELVFQGGRYYPTHIAKVLVNVPEWISKHGPPGGVVNNFAILKEEFNSTIYAATTAGIFRTHNAGDSWTLLANGLPVLTTGINAVAIDPLNPAILYAGTNGNGVYKTTDAGNNWHIDNGSDSRKIPNDAVINSIATGIIYKDNKKHVRVLAATAAGTVYFSDNGGKEWKAAQGLPAPKPVSELLVIHDDEMNVDNNSFTIFAGIGSGSSDGGGVYKSTNSGETWVPSSGVKDAEFLACTPQDISTFSVISFAEDNLGNIYAGTYKNSIFISSDGGNTWCPPDVPIVFPSNNKRIAAITTVFNETTHRDDIFLGSRNDGVYKSTDSGKTWFDFNGTAPTSILNKQMVSILGHAGQVYAGNIGGGVLKSPANSAVWHAKNHEFNNASVLTSLTVANNGILAGVDGNGIWLLPNTGSNPQWQALNNGLNNSGALSPRGIAVTPDMSKIYTASNGDGMYTSSYPTVNWSKINTSPSSSANAISGRAILAPSNVDIFAGTSSSNGGGIFKLQPSPLLFIKQTTQNQYVRSLAANVPTLVYAGTDTSSIPGGVWRLQSGIWSALSNDMTGTFVRAVAVAPNGTVYAGGSVGDEIPPGFVYRSVDNGNTWQLITSGLPVGTVYSLAVAPSGEVFAAIASSGIYRLSHHGGVDHWFPFNAGLDLLGVRSLAIKQNSPDPHDYTVYAGTQGKGVLSRNTR